MSSTIENYLLLSSQYPGFLVLYRIGEFYETFFSDAKVVSGALNMHLTTRGAYNGEPVPLCGFPARSLEDNIARLLAKGYRVAVTKEGKLDPSTYEPDRPDSAPREKSKVHRVIDFLCTPATYVAEGYFRINNRPERWIAMLVAIPCNPTGIGVVCIDIASENFVFLDSDTSSLSSVLDSLCPMEVLYLSEKSVVGSSLPVAGEGPKSDCAPNNKKWFSSVVATLSPFCFDSIRLFGTKPEPNARIAGLITGGVSSPDACQCLPEDRGLANSLSKLIGSCEKYSPMEFAVPTELFSFADNLLSKILSNKLLDLDPADALPTFVQIGLPALLSYIKQMNPSLDINPRILNRKQALFLNKGVCNIISPNGFFGQNSLFSYLDKTLTTAGKAFLANQIRYPYSDKAKIEARLDVISWLLKTQDVADMARLCLEGIKDIRRLISLIASGRYYGGQLLALSQSLRWCLKLIDCVKDHSMDFASKMHNGKVSLDQSIGLQVKELSKLLSQSISHQAGLSEEGPVEEPAILLSLEPHPALKAKYSEFVRHRNALMNLALKYKAEFGSSSLYYRNGSGYVIEIRGVGKGRSIPDIVSTLQNANDQLIDNISAVSVANIPHSIVELKKSSAIVTNLHLQKLTLQIQLAKEAFELEQRNTLAELSQQISLYRSTIHLLADFVGEVDFLLAMSIVSGGKYFCRPLFSENCIDILQGFHPILTEVKGGIDGIVPNNLFLTDTCRTMVVHGANMSGKSTFLRQFVILQIVAQIGCFVTAEKFTTIVSDGIFARVGSGDDLYGSKSTFFNEMEELGEILSFSTDRSLCVIDEIGRGTNAAEGFAIAVSALEFLTDRKRPFLLFATHYHDIKDNVVGIDDKIQFGYMESLDKGDDIVFTNKMVIGHQGNVGSHAILVAKKAGLCAAVLEGATRILQHLRR